MTNAELVQKYRPLVSDPFVLHDIVNVNFKPHPYMIGGKHVTMAAERYGGMLGEDVLRRVPCAHDGCRLSYDEHTSDRVMALELTRNASPDEARDALMKIWKSREEYLATHPEIAEAVQKIDHSTHVKNHFVRDVLRKLNQWGTLTERQAAAVVASLKRDIEFAAKRAVEAAEIKGDAPEGRVTVTGVVVGLKDYENDFGVTQKMTLKLDNNARVWLTVPSKADVSRGDRVTVTATFTRSKDDQSFAFGKRPSNVTVAAHQEVA